jgi:gamma-glutamyl:cysteine ligase YbdK (ATP-grasp superfamily)
MFEQYTLGIEEEFQIVDPNTRELRSHVSEILEEGRMVLGEKIKPEMIQSMIEVGTGHLSQHSGGAHGHYQPARDCLVAGAEKRVGGDRRFDAPDLEME